MSAGWNRSNTHSSDAAVILFNAFVVLRMSVLPHTDDGRDIELTAQGYNAAWVLKEGW